VAIVVLGHWLAWLRGLLMLSDELCFLLSVGIMSCSLSSFSDRSSVDGACRGTSREIVA